MGVRISELPETTGINKEDLLIIEDGQGTKKGTVQQLDEALGVSQLNDALVSKGIIKEMDNSLLIPNGFIDNNGVLTTGNEYNGLYYTEFIEVSDMITKIVVYTSLRYCYIAWYDENQKFIQVINDKYEQKAGLYELIPPNNAKFVRLSCANYDVAQGSYDKFYVKFEFNIFNEIDQLKIKTSLKITPEMTTFVKPKTLDITGNIALEDEYTKDAFLDDGQIVHNEYTKKYCCTGKIPVLPSKPYYSRSFQDNLQTSIYAIAQYKSDGTFIEQTRSGYIVTDPECTSIIVCISNDGTEDVSPDIGSGILVVKQTDVEPSEYEPPRYHPLELPDSDYVKRSEIKNIIESNSDIKLELSDSYNLVVGDTFELFWKGAVKCLNPNDFYIEVKCSKGYPWRRKFEFTPTLSDVGTHVMQVSLYNQERTLLDEKTVSLIVKPKATNPSNEKVVLYVGDSLTSKGYVVDELQNRLVNKDSLSNITFIGDKDSERNGIKYVGNGGWSWAQYNDPMIDNSFMWITCTHDKTGNDQHSIYEDENKNQWKLETIENERIKIIRVSPSGILPTSGTLTWVSGGEHNSNIVYTSSEQASGNPFWNMNTSKIDFANFVARCGKSKLDYLYVLLGWNATGISESDLKSQVRTFVNNVRLSYPDCEITLLGIQIPAMEGLAQNYGAGSGVLSSYYLSMSHVFNLNKWYSEVASEFNNVSFVNVASQFDTEYNMQEGTLQVNARNITRIPRQSNGVHPAESGYYQIADVCYRDLTHKLQ